MTERYKTWGRCFQWDVLQVAIGPKTAEELRAMAQSFVGGIAGWLYGTNGRQERVVRQGDRHYLDHTTCRTPFYHSFALNDYNTIMIPKRVGRLRGEEPEIRTSTPGLFDLRTYVSAPSRRNWQGTPYVHYDPAYLIAPTIGRQER
jgi:hypothetical protein